MDLKHYITTSHKEIAGSRSKNRLSIQISYAMQLIMEFYTIDYIILMDYIEDIAVISNPDNPDQIYLYQIKTKKTGYSFSLQSIIEDEWFDKLYNNAGKFNGALSKAAIVCNTEVLDKKQNRVFPNQCTYLTEEKITNNVKKIRAAIAQKKNIPEESIDLSKFCFIKAWFTVQKHREEAEYEFENFLRRKNDSIQVALARTIFGMIYDELDRKFNAEIEEDCSDINEIYENKGLKGEYISNLIECGVSIQLPDPKKLYDAFNISAVNELRSYNSVYTRLKTDLLQSSSQLFELKRLIQRLVEEKVSYSKTSLEETRDLIFQLLESDEIIPIQYKDDDYLKLLIMILLYKFCYGGNNYETGI